jgi:hypothetical protein
MNPAITPTVIGGVGERTWHLVHQHVTGDPAAQAHQHDPDDGEVLVMVGAARKQSDLLHSSSKLQPLPPSQLPWSASGRRLADLKRPWNGCYVSVDA